MVGGEVGGWIIGAGLFLWANREAILKVAAEAVALAEKANCADMTDTQLEDLAVAAFRQVKSLRWVPEPLARAAIRGICRRRRKAIRKLARIE